MVANAAQCTTQRKRLLVGNSIEKQRANDLDMARENAEELGPAGVGERDDRGTLVIW